MLKFKDERNTLRGPMLDEKLLQEYSKDRRILISCQYNQISEIVQAPNTKDIYDG